MDQNNFQKAIGIKSAELLKKCSNDECVVKYIRSEIIQHFDKIFNLSVLSGNSFKHFIICFSYPVFILISEHVDRAKTLAQQHKIKQVEKDIAQKQREIEGLLKWKNDLNSSFLNEEDDDMFLSQEVTKTLNDSLETHNSEIKDENSVQATESEPPKNNKRKIRKCETNK